MEVPVEEGIQAHAAELPRTDESDVVEAALSQQVAQAPALPSEEADRLAELSEEGPGRAVEKFLGAAQKQRVDVVLREP